MFIYLCTVFTHNFFLPHLLPRLAGLSYFVSCFVMKENNFREDTKDFPKEISRSKSDKSVLFWNCD